MHNLLLKVVLVAFLGLFVTSGVVPQMAFAGDAGESSSDGGAQDNGDDSGGEGEEAEKENEETPDQKAERVAAELTESVENAESAKEIEAALSQAQAELNGVEGISPDSNKAVTEAVENAVDAISESMGGTSNMAAKLGVSVGNLYGSMNPTPKATPSTTATQASTLSNMAITSQKASELGAAYAAANNQNRIAGGSINCGSCYSNMQTAKTNLQSFTGMGELGVAGASFSADVGTVADKVGTSGIVSGIASIGSVIMTGGASLALSAVSAASTAYGVVTGEGVLSEALGFSTPEAKAVAADAAVKTNVENMYDKPTNVSDKSLTNSYTNSVATRAQAAKDFAAKANADLASAKSDLAKATTAAERAAAQSRVANAQDKVSMASDLASSSNDLASKQPSGVFSSIANGARSLFNGMFGTKNELDAHAAGNLAAEQAQMEAVAQNASVKTAAPTAKTGPTAAELSEVARTEKAYRANPTGNYDPVTGKDNYSRMMDARAAAGSTFVDDVAKSAGVIGSATASAFNGATEAVANTISDLTNNQNAGVIGASKAEILGASVEVTDLSAPSAPTVSKGNMISAAEMAEIDAAINTQNNISTATFTNASVASTFNARAEITDRVNKLEAQTPELESRVQNAETADQRSQYSAQLEGHLADINTAKSYLGANEVAETPTTNSLYQKAVFTGSAN